MNLNFHTILLQELDKSILMVSKVIEKKKQFETVDIYS